jgi:AraC family transcriptional regulator
MEPRIENIATKKLVGKSIQMTMLKNRTGELWQSFMPRKKEIKNAIDNLLYSVEIYHDSYFNYYNPNKELEKWAAVEVDDFNSIPQQMQSLIIAAGMYAVFTYKGSSNEGQKAYQYIFERWIPNSNFVLDNRPHFAVMGEKYRNGDPGSEEEIWIPIKNK